ncbi:hypothetical protein K8942_02025 [Candidatus Peribacteria bacterium]|nr:MAG: hypothetical protein K8942_02025 [Candidatus Peribacteria bacterium]
MRPLDSVSGASEGQDVPAAASSSLLSRVSTLLRGAMGHVIKSPLLPHKSDISEKDADQVTAGIESIDESTLTPEALSSTERLVGALEQIGDMGNEDLPTDERDARALALLAQIQGLPVPANPLKTVKTIRNAQEKIRGNDPCPCGCGKKFKNCPNRKD